MSRQVGTASLRGWREQAIRRMTRSRDATLRFLAGVPEADLLRPRTQGRWSVKDVLAHIAAWEEEAIRRFALFTVICLALAATVLLGVTSLYNALTFLIGVGGTDAEHNAVDFAVPALLVAAVFGAHLWLLLRDQRRTRPLESAAAPADPLVELLEGVRAGRVPVTDAAARLRLGP